MTLLGAGVLIGVLLSWFFRAPRATSEPVLPFGRIEPVDSARLALSLRRRT